LQEQIDRESIAITVKATKLTARTLEKALMAVLKKLRQKTHELPHGKQSVKSLMKHNVSTNTIPIDGDKGLFERVARKWNVDYAFHKTGQDKYLLLFKSGQSDAITAAFAEYTKRVVKRDKDKRAPMKEQMAKAAERVKQEQTQHKTRKRIREVVRE
jgi:hypothetical protein